MKKSILMSVITSPHGLKGEVQIKSFSDDPFALSRYQTLYDEKGKIFRIMSLRLHKAKIVAHIDGVTNRNEAEELAGRQLFVDRQSLDDDLDSDEFYQSDLLGFRAVDAQAGHEIGRISGFFNFGAGDLVEISAASGKSWLIPFSRAAVPVIDREQETMRIDAQAAGLVDDGDEEETLA